MRKIAAAILCGALLPAATASAGCERETKDSTFQRAAAAVRMQGGENIPVRELFEAMGMEVDYADGCVTAQDGDGRISLYIGGRELNVNGKSIRLDEAPFIRRGRAFISPEAILRALGIYDKEKPTAAPTAKPTAAPTAKPTAAPTVNPTAEPKPTAVPTMKPTAAPTARPTAVPTARPTAKPTAAPTVRPTTTPAVSSEREMEQQVLALVNKTRAEYGLNPLTWAEDLAVVARAHSSDMIRRSFFDHTNPDGKSPFDRIKAAGITYRTAAENIAYGQRSPEEVMNAWMNSSGHRANILNAKVKEMGVGAVRNSGGTIYWTQLFVAR